MSADLRRLAEQATPGPWENPNPPGSTRDDGHGWPVHGPTWPVADAGMLSDAAYIAAANPQAILALLDERDAYRELIDTLAEWQVVAERRVAALEEGLLALVQDMDSQNVGTNVFELTDPPVWHGLLGGKPYAKARALLDKYELQVDRGNKWIEIANDWHRNAIAAERRVAALEDGLLEACRAECGPWFDEGSEKGKLDPAELADRIIADCLAARKELAS